MRQTLLYFLLFFMLFIKSFGQTDLPKLPTDNKKTPVLPLYNLYYLSKYITSENLESEQILQIYSSLISNSDLDLNQEQILVYNKPQKGKDELNPIGKFLNKKNVINELVRKNIISNYENGNFEDYQKPGLKEELFALKNNYEKIKNLKEKFDIYSNHLDKIKQYEKLDVSITVDTVNIDKAILKLLRDKNINNPPYSNTDFTNLKKEMVNDSSVVEKYNKNIINYAEKYVNQLGNSGQDPNMKPLDPEIKSTSTEIKLNSIVNSSEQRAAISSYNLPSESDMINAMAMFLAKRAKQETVIWFMDKLRENIKNPLVFEAFPETIKLIENLADYKAPTFSVAWRNAIATDFVKMPTNLAKSAWVQSFIFNNDPQKIQNLSTAVDFGYDFNRLISEKYNYRDIIRFFYTSPTYDKLIDSQTALPQGENMKSVLKSSISILYILTNELFAVDEIDGKKHYRLLTYEEVNSLSKVQWIALGQLIQLKYPSTNPKFNNFFKHIYNNEKKELSKWVGNLLISLSQFDKVNKDFQELRDNKTDISNVNFYNVWQNSLQIIDNLDYTKYLSPTPKEKVVNTSKPYIDILKESTIIYEQIQNKNFPVAVHNTMKLIQKISLQKESLIKGNIIVNDIHVEFTNDQIFLKSNGEVCGIKPVFDKKQINAVQINNMDKNNNLEVPIKFNKIQPFLSFVSSLKEDDDTFTIIKSLDQSFQNNLDKISDCLHISQLNTIALLNLVNLYTKEGLDMEKFLSYKNTFNNNISIEKNKDVERIKHKYQDQLLNITSFFGDVLVAKNAEELADVIDSHALPPTSYKLKRRVARSLDLNGYVGIQGSHILPNGITSLNEQNTIGITAPIGFAYTWSSLNKPKPKNWGFTVDIVDLGNIVNHYLVSTTNDNTEDLHFSEVFSPAASFMYAIRNSPFVLFASAKLLPLKTSHTLNPITNENIKIDSKAFDATILSIGIKIDIPLINLWSKLDTN